ncbi:hypothetical protein [Dokdonella koreensis]|uniref:Uncharacterized protein n=1 Tax=Dokdonella koreensis DS-123 TaxID=1300342 RepID=A0A161HQA3_9GAMM|nr:hypothetical protein [Dokdonella koreensis]ANB16057.1 Hypothetical protein I596_17 [Dokdonella koreensis DS-123]
MPRTNPLLLADGLALRRRLAAAARRPRWALAALGALLAACAGAWMLAPWPPADRLAVWLAAAPAGVLVLAGALAAIRTRRLRRRWRAAQARSWLAALPVTPGQRAVATTVRLALAQAGPLAGALAALGWLALAGSPGAFPLRLAVLVAAGWLAGSLIGAGFDRRPAAPRRRQPRTAARPAGASGWRVLAAWPLRIARAQADPAVHARVLGPLILAMPLPMSTPLDIVLPALLVLVALVALVECLRGLLAAIAASGGWLRGTPLAGRRFVVALCSRSALVQLGGLLVLFALFLRGLPPRAALAGTVLPAVVAAIAVASAFVRHRPLQAGR